MFGFRAVNPNHVVLEFHVPPRGCPRFPDSGPRISKEFNKVRSVLALPLAVGAPVGLPNLSNELHELLPAWNRRFRKRDLGPFDRGRRAGQNEAVLLCVIEDVSHGFEFMDESLSSEFASAFDGPTFALKGANAPK